MVNWLVGAVGTFILSLILSYGFLRLRCRGIGPPFGRRSRYWAFFIVVATAIVSTGLGLLIVAASNHVHAAYVGVIVPAGLWFSKFPPQRDQDLRLRTMPMLLTLPLSRLYDRMGDDMQDWRDIRLSAVSEEPKWVSDAVTYYYGQVAGRLRDAKARADLDRWRDSITHKINIVRLIDMDASAARLRIALQMHPATQHIRKYDDGDLRRLARRLESEALNELGLFLAYVYRLGHHKLLIYPFRPSAQRAHAQRA